MTTWPRIALAILAVVPPVLRAQPASFRGLGFESVAALSADGSTAIGYTPGGVARWRALTGTVVIPYAPGLEWGPEALSGDGSQVSGYQVPGGSTALAEAVRWSAATGLLPQGFPGNYVVGSIARDISADGQVIVGSGTKFGEPCGLGGGTTLTTAFRQSHPGGPLHKLGALAGQNCSAALGVSGDGITTVGESFDSSCLYTANHQACLWTGNGQPTPLGWLPGLTESSATAASHDGSVVVGLGWNPQVLAQRAFQWTASTGIESLELLPGTIASEPGDVSADGSVIVGGCMFVVASVMHGRACIWDEVHGVRAVPDVLFGLGVNVGDWTLTHAVGVSADGRAIVGNGINPAGQQEAWMAFLGDAVCYPDCNADGALTVADFGCFQTKFVAADPYADCNADGQLTVADFGCFQTKFVQSCP